MPGPPKPNPNPVSMTKINITNIITDSIATSYIDDKKDDVYVGISDDMAGNMAMTWKVVMTWLPHGC